MHLLDLISPRPSSRLIHDLSKSTKKLVDKRNIIMGRTQIDHNGFTQFSTIILRENQPRLAKYLICQQFPLNIIAKSLANRSKY